MIFLKKLSVISCFYFCGRAGIETTIFERERKLGGVPRYVIPAFRISDEAIDKDIALMLRYGVEVKCGKSAPSVAELKEMGYTSVQLSGQNPTLDPSAVRDALDKYGLPRSESHSPALVD